MEDFLRDRGVNEEIIERFIDEKITEETVSLMADEELKEFLPKYGDRIALRSFLARRKNPKTSEKMSLLEKLRMRLKRKRESESEERKSVVENKEEPVPAQKSCYASNAIKAHRRVEVGLMLFDPKKERYMQVKAPRGGGVRVLKIAKTSNKMEIIQHAQSVFLNGKPESFGKQEDYDCDLMDIKENILPDGISLIEVIETTKLQRIKFYLAVRAKKNTTTESLPDVEDGVNETVVTVASDIKTDLANNETNLSGDDINLNVAASTSESSITGLSNTEISNIHPTTSATESLVADAFSASFQDVTANVAAYQDVVYLTNNDNVVFEDSRGEIQFLSQQHNYFGSVGIAATDTNTILQLADDTETNEGSHIEREELTIKLHRGQIFDELKDHFKTKMDLNKHTVKLEVFLPNGQKEIAEDSGGVLRDVLSEFWEGFYKACTLGENIKVPILRHDFNYDDWAAVAKVFIFGWREQKYFPLHLSKAFMSYCLYGVDSFANSTEQLIDEFKRFVPELEREVIENTMKGEYDEKDVEDVLTAHDCRVQPTPENFRKTLGEIAHKELLQQPTFVKDCWNELFKVNNFVFDQDLSTLYDKLIPSAKKVLEILQFPEQMDGTEQDIAKYLKRFVRGLDCETISLFMRFCTGADILTMDSNGAYHTIQIQFNKIPVSAFARRPIGHTCGRVLELWTNYDDFLQFKNEFVGVLKSNIWAMEYH